MIAHNFSHTQMDTFSFGEFHDDFDLQEPQMSVAAYSAAARSRMEPHGFVDVQADAAPSMRCSRGALGRAETHGLNGKRDRVAVCEDILASRVTGQPPSFVPKAELIRRRCFKTRMCPHHARKACVMGSACMFAHTAQELRPPPSLEKTKMCYKLQKFGNCAEAETTCRFAHNASELRKVAVCEYFLRGKCFAGSSCGFVHTRDKVAGSVGSSPASTAKGSERQFEQNTTKSGRSAPYVGASSPEHRSVAALPPWQHAQSWNSSNPHIQHATYGADHELSHPHDNHLEYPVAQLLPNAKLGADLRASGHRAGGFSAGDRWDIHEVHRASSTECNETEDELQESTLESPTQAFCGRHGRTWDANGQLAPAQGFSMVGDEDEDWDPFPRSDLQNRDFERFDEQVARSNGSQVGEFYPDGRISSTSSLPFSEETSEHMQRTLPARGQRAHQMMLLVAPGSSTTPLDPTEAPDSADEDGKDCQRTGPKRKRTKRKKLTQPADVVDSSPPVDEVLLQLGLQRFSHHFAALDVSWQGLLALGPEHPCIHVLPLGPRLKLQAEMRVGGACQ